MVKAVIVGTNASELQGHPTGAWLEEIAEPYYRFRDAGYQVIIASPKGGEIPMDQNSLKEVNFTSTCKQFMEDAAAQSKLTKSVPLSEIDWSTVDAIYLAGGHGTCVDFVANNELKQAIEKLALSDGKVVAADCHGPIGLVQCLVNGEHLIKGKKVTGFTDSEEAAVGLTEKVPFLIESKFKELGALYAKEGDFASHVCIDGNLITGQNPQSSKACAQAVVDCLG